MRDELEDSHGRQNVSLPAPEQLAGRTTFLIGCVSQGMKPSVRENTMPSKRKDDAENVENLDNDAPPAQSLVVEDAPDDAALRVTQARKDNPLLPYVQASYEARNPETGLGAAKRVPCVDEAMRKDIYNMLQRAATDLSVGVRKSYRDGYVYFRTKPKTQRKYSKADVVNWALASGYGDFSESKSIPEDVRNAFREANGFA